MNYERDKGGIDLDFGGINIAAPIDRMPANKFPYAQNVRRYLQGGIMARALQSVALFTLGFKPISIRRLNDSTPNGPSSGYALVIGDNAGNLYLNGGVVDAGYSGNPLSLTSFRPNASPQPWMYASDSFKMSKIRSNGTVYKQGIMEPQAAPTVTFIPASDQVSLVGAVTVYYFNNPTQSHSAPLEGVYIWKNASDPVGGSSVIQTIGDAVGSAQGNSLLFDYAPSDSPPIDGSGAVPVAWSQFVTYQGTVDTVGTSVTWDSGDQFTSQSVALTTGSKIVIGGVTYTVAGSVTNTSLTLTTSAGNQTSVNYSASLLGGTVPLFVPAMESQGYQDFNCSILASLYIPAAGTYTISGVVKDDLLWGIGNSASGTASWAGPTGGQTLSTIGQTITTINGYPLIPRTQETSGEDGHYTTFSQAITFSAPGNYPIEFDWDYWYHTPRGLVVQCNGVNIPPIPTTTITDSQYRYTYRSSVTGALSNPSPASPQTGLSVLANNVTATPSTDPQVDSIDFYRLDEGLENFTYVGTVSGSPYSSTTNNAIAVTGIPVSVQLNAPISPSSAIPVIGQQMEIDTGANQETVKITNVFYFDFTRLTVTAVFTKTHASGVPIKALIVTFNDTLLDTDIAANPILEYDNYEPFPSIDLPKSGAVAVSANGVVLWVSGDQFNTRWLPGTVILIGTVAYTLYNRPSATTELIAQNVDIVNGVETAVYPPATTLTPYAISEPILAAQPLPFVWGPTDNVVFQFGAGDPLRPGTLYWTKGNNFDSAPDTNQQDVTSPSEPLQNGVWASGFGMVFSAERAWIIFPNYFNALATVNGTEGTTWTLQLSGCGRGLYMPWCLAAEGAMVFYRAKDGICVSVAGSKEKSITDGDLYPLFPHEGKLGKSVTVAGNTIFPPDDTKPTQQRLSCATGFLYYDYVGTDGNPHTLVYDIANQAWCPDVYQFPVLIHALEEGPDVNAVLVGCTDNSVRTLGSSTSTEVATSLVCLPAYDAGETRAQKHWGDAYLEVDNPASVSLTIQPYTALYTNMVSSGLWNSKLNTSEGRNEIVLDFLASGIYEGLYSRDIECVLSWPVTGSTVILRRWQPSLIPQPEGVYDRPSDWMDGGYPGAKFIQGVIVEADSFGVSKTFNLQASDDLSQHTLLEAPAVFSKQTGKAFSCVPFVAHSARILAADGVEWRVWKSQLVFQPYPELAMNWTPPETALGLVGWGHLREMNIAHISTANLTLTLLFDAWPTIVLTIPSSGGVFQKLKVTLPPNKFKLVQPSLVSTAPFRLFAPEIEVKLGQWGRQGGYRIVKPFGGDNQAGAQV